MSFNCSLLLFLSSLCSNVLGATLAGNLTESNSKFIRSSNPKPSIGIYSEPQVFLTVSSLATGGEEKDRWLELNWNNWVDFDGTRDWVGLYDFDPNVFDGLPLVQVGVNSSRGYFRTERRFHRIPLDVNGDACQSGFWAAYHRLGGTPLKSSCLSIYPKWMNDQKDVIGGTPLGSLMIPGTHDAGAWRHYAGTSHDNVFIRFTVNQEETLYDQMVYGIRYFDIRVAYYPHTKEIWWINHGSTIFHPLDTLFDAIRRFVSETNEIILMDYHGFPVGMDSAEVHHALVAYTNGKLGDLLLNRSEVANPQRPTPNEFWSKGKNVILTYQRSDINVQYEILWPYLVHAWGNKNNVTELEAYFAEEIPRRGCNGYLWSAMAELTAREIDYIINLEVGLRGFADWVNIPATYWFQREDWYSNCNIIATDYFLGNNIIQMCIEGNLKRCPCNETCDKNNKMKAKS